MAQYRKSTPLTGSWIKGQDISSGTKCKLTSETEPTASQFKNKDGSIKYQDVARIKFQDNPQAEYNIAINRASLNALIDAFGEDSENWIGKILMAETEKMRVGGKAVTVIYLMPEGYERIDDENGYAVIVKKGTNAPILEEEAEETGGEVPF